VPGKATSTAATTSADPLTDVTGQPAQPGHTAPYPNNHTLSDAYTTATNWLEHHSPTNLIRNTTGQAPLPAETGKLGQLKTELTGAVGGLLDAVPNIAIATAKEIRRHPGEQHSPSLFPGSQLIAPALKANGPNQLEGMAQTGRDINARYSPMAHGDFSRWVHDYLDHPVRALAEDAEGPLLLTGAGRTVAGFIARGAARGAESALAKEASTTAADRAVTPKPATDAATATTKPTKAAASEAGAATPQAAIPHEPPTPPAQNPQPAGAPAPTRSESEPLTTGSGARDPTRTATAPPSGSVAAGSVGRRPAGKVAARPGGASDSDPTGAAGTRPGRPARIVGGRLGGADEPAPVTAGDGDPLFATGAGNRPAASRAQAPTASTPKPPRNADESRQDAGRAADISGPSIARDIGPVEGGRGGTPPLDRSPEDLGTTPAGGGPSTARSGTGLGRSDVDSVPNGFSSKNEFAEFGNQLYSGLAKAGYGETTPAFQGSSVTGRSFRTGEPFDEGRRSDFDIALGGEDIIRAAELEGVKLRSKGTRTGPLTSGQLRRLGLNDMARDLSSRTGRDVHFMIYRSVDEAIRHKPSIAVPR